MCGIPAHHLQGNKKKKPISPMVGIMVTMLWLFGGNSNNGSNCGLAYANSNNAWSNANSNISARHTLSKNYKSVSTASWEITRLPRTSAVGAYVKPMLVGTTFTLHDGHQCLRQWY